MSFAFDPPPCSLPPSGDLQARDQKVDWQRLESIVHHDPARRGLASFRHANQPLDAGHYRAAAIDLAQRATGVGIVTGFCARGPDGVTAETDGPPGALFLARALSALGIRVWLISDQYASPLLAAGLRHWRLRSVSLLEMPLAATATFNSSAGGAGSSGTAALIDRWMRDFWDSALPQKLSHLIAIERPGPSHSASTLAARADATPETLARFAADVPAADQGICHSMRGDNLEAWTAPLHRLFDEIEQQQGLVTTIGIGDGGNEIGMGRYAWQTLVEAIGSEAAPRIICRVPTHYGLIAGVSDWGAYALALSLAVLRGESDKARNWTSVGQSALIEAIVQETSAVDGVALLHQATVDGLPLEAYLRPLDQLRELLQITVD